MRITKDMTIFDILRSHPQAAEVLEHHDMSCSSCLAIVRENIENGARRHGVDLSHLLTELNALFDQEGK